MNDYFYSIGYVLLLPRWSTNIGDISMWATAYFDLMALADEENQ